MGIFHCRRHYAYNSHLDAFHIPQARLVLKTLAMKNIAITMLLLLSLAANATDITIEGVEWMRNAASKNYSARFTVSWNNSWRTDRRIA